jgi:hypothetical protein
VKMGASLTDLRDDDEEDEVDGRLRSMGPRGSRVGMTGNSSQDKGRYQDDKSRLGVYRRRTCWYLSVYIHSS